MDFATLATKYVGQTADCYEQRRHQTSMWNAQEQGIRELLEQIPTAARVLDIPVGTGRLLSHLNARGFEAYGLDVSSDMLSIAKARAASIGMDVDLGVADIRHIPIKDGFFDLVICLRFLNWVDAEGVEQVVKELARVSRDKLLLGIRVVPSLGRLAQGPRPIARLGMRAIGAARRRERRLGLHFLPQSFFDELFAELGLGTVETRHIDRRIDGTDYAFFLVAKN
jgi:SAM-dependent methyltransferase